MDSLVIDLETKKSFEEVGGKQNIRDLGISVAGVYSYDQDKFFAFEENQLAELEEMLLNTNHLIGFNLKGFDNLVLEPYLKKVSLAKIAITDIFEDAVKFLGHRVGLAGVAQATLGESKSANGLEALEWYKKGEMQKIKDYCLQDVKVTRDLYDYGKKHGHILFESFIDHKTHSIPVVWGRAPEVPVAKLVEDAFNQRKRLSVEYVSSENNDGLGFNKQRLIDIHKIKGEEIEAYCHLRQSVRIFRLGRILRAELTGESYILPQDLQKSLF
ncbi:MAG: WYL domain-containing protein [bacterium]|nr:WYL domain-containing protein [bacterium]